MGLFSNILSKQTCELCEKEENTNKVYAAHVEVQKSPIMKENMQFDTAEFVKSADFQHLLQTLSAKLVEE